MPVLSTLAIAAVVLFAPVSGLSRTTSTADPRSSGPSGLRRRARRRPSRRLPARWRSCTPSSSRRRSRASPRPSTADPGCAIAYWGIALSRWGNPFAAGIKPPAQLEAGRAAIDKARAIGAKTDRERDYIAAADRLFADFEKVDQRDAAPRLPRCDGRPRRRSTPTIPRPRPSTPWRWWPPTIRPTRPTRTC